MRLPAVFQILKYRQNIVAKIKLMSWRGKGCLTEEKI